MTSEIGKSSIAEDGQRAALISAESISSSLRGSNLVFIVGGLGGSTGSGASAIIARIAKEQNALVVSIVTYPFNFEGKQRGNEARKGITWLKRWSDTLIVIPNDRLLQLANGTIGFHQTYEMAGLIWRQAIQGLNDLVNNPGLINIDFADVQAIMAEGGGAIIASGRGVGKNRARIAAEMATRSEVLGLTIHGANGLIFNVCGGRDLSLLEVEEAAEIITETAQPLANVIFGAAINPFLGDEVHITILATGFEFQAKQPSKANGAARKAPVTMSNQPWRMTVAQPLLANFLFDSQLPK